MEQWYVPDSIGLIIEISMTYFGTPQNTTLSIAIFKIFQPFQRLRGMYSNFANIQYISHPYCHFTTNSSFPNDTISRMLKRGRGVRAEPKSLGLRPSYSQNKCKCPGE